MTREEKARLADYFDAGGFAELIGVTTEDLIEAFEERVEEALEDLEELMGIRRDDE